MNEDEIIAASASTQEQKLPVETDIANIVDNLPNLVTVTRKHEKAIIMTDFTVLSEVTGVLTGPNFLEWSKMVRIYLRSISMSHHLTEDPPTDIEEWLGNDARLFLLIQNSIHNDVVGLVSHCEYVKEMMEYLESIYASKKNNFLKYDVCKKCFRPKQREGQSFESYYMEAKNAYEELKLLFPFTSDIKEMRTREEQIGVLCFLAGLDDRFEIARSQILSSPEIPSLDEVYIRLRHVEYFASLAQAPSAHVSSNNVGLDRVYEGQNQGSNGDNRSSYKKIVCYYCHEPGHTKHTCYKLQRKAQRSRSDPHNAMAKPEDYWI